MYLLPEQSDTGAKMEALDQAYHLASKAIGSEAVCLISLHLGVIPPTLSQFHWYRGGVGWSMFHAKTWLGEGCALYGINSQMDYAK